MSWMLGAGGGRGGGGGDGRLLPTSAKWFAIIIAAISSILFSVDVWTLVEDDAAIWIAARYDGIWAVAVFWALKLGTYPLVFFAVRLLMALLYLGLTLMMALKLFSPGPRP